MSKFVREELTIDGVKTVVHTAGKGDPLVLFHGAGTVDGFDFAETWADKFRVIVPYHPGFGDSGADPQGRWQVDPDEGLADLLGLLRAGAESTRMLVAGAELSELGAVGGRFSADNRPTLNWILFHVLQEYTRHTGHLDIVRELADGSVGE